MADKRPCSVCKRWFTKDPRAGARQHVCGRPECHAERNKRACATWRKENPEKVIEGRLRRQLPMEPPEPPEVVVLNPMRHFSPSVVRHVMGPKATVVLEEVAKVLVHLARHEVPPKRQVRRRQVSEVFHDRPRHETVPRPAPP